MTKMKSSQLHGMDESQFVEAIGHVFERSPWIARKAYAQRPFDSVVALHKKLIETMRAATPDEKLALIRAHPDLVGKMVSDEALTPESAEEQRAAGLAALSPREVDLFQSYNAQYRARFGFPFVICARENKKDAILAAFPARLQNNHEQEMEAALVEIAKIARLRLIDAIQEE